MAGTWVASVSFGSVPSFRWAAHRVDQATGTIEQSVTVRSDGFPVDIAATDDGVWVLLQANPGPSTLVRIDATTGSVIGETPIADMAVRLVATDDELVIGTDTSGGGGRFGAVTLVDPTTGAATASASLDARPEAIVLVDDLIITSGLRVLDRRTLTVHPVHDEGHLVGFAMARAGDDLWVTDRGGTPDTSVVRRIPRSTLRAAIADPSSPVLGSGSSSTAPPIDQPPGWSLLSQAVLRPVAGDAPPPTPAWLRTGSDMTEMFTGPAGSVPVFDAPDGAVVGYLFDVGYVSRALAESPDFDVDAIRLRLGMCPKPATEACIAEQLERSAEIGERARIERLAEIEERRSGGS